MYNLFCNLDILQALGDICSATFYSLNIKTTETTGLKNKNKVAMFLFRVFIFFPQNLVVLFILQSLVLIVNITHNKVVKRKQKRLNEQLFHPHTFRPVASGVRQTLNFRKTVGSCRKLVCPQITIWWLDSCFNPAGRALCCRDVQLEDGDGSSQGPGPGMEAMAGKTEDPLSSISTLLSQCQYVRG